MHPELLVRKRIWLMTLVLTGLFLLAAARIAVLTTSEAASLTERGIRQWTKAGIVTARRGTITDRKGRTLAISATAYIVTADPRLVSDTEKFLDSIEPVLNINKETARKRLQDKTKGSIILKRQVSRETVDALRQLRSEAPEDSGLKALSFDEDICRYYPYGALLSQVLGLTTVDSDGQSGLESRYEDVLRGTEGSYLRQVDARNRQLDGTEGWYIPSQQGCGLVLTIDAEIQEMVEKAMRECIEVNQAQSVICLVSDVKTGAILAMCMNPCYDPNDPPRNDIQTLTERMRNRLITDAYEPGSTFKMITMSAALEEKLTNRSEWFYCSGSVYVEGGRIKCWGRPHGSESLTQALENSCNPVFVELGLRLGTDRFYKYLNAYGFGQKTGVDIPGEGSGIVIGKSAVKRVDIARIGFGQSIAVTPVQLLTAACAVVNGGKLMTPYVVKEIRDADGNVIERGEPTVRATPISEGTSKIMREMLESVVKNGGGKNAYIDGYHIGGKTGTAQVYIDGVVSSDTHIGSFIGFAPMDDPQIALMVIIDRAERRPDYGSTTAAPFARDILLQTLAYLKVPRESAVGADEATTVPNVSGDTLNQAIKSLKAEGLGYMLSGAGARVRDQMPEPGAEMTKGSVVMLYMDGDAEVDADAWIEVPDVKGKSVMEVNQTLISCGLRLKLSGSGIACSQSPEAGEYVFPDAVVDVTFAFPGEE